MGRVRSREIKNPAPGEDYPADEKAYERQLRSERSDIVKRVRADERHFRISTLLHPPSPPAPGPQEHSRHG